MASALDAPGEFFFDRTTQRLLLRPNRSGCEGEVSVAVPTLATVISIHGTEGVRIQEIGFKYTSRTILKRYTVPSPGDWAIYLGGTVELTNVTHCVVSGCSFNRTGSNAIFIGQRAQGTVSGPLHSRSHRPCACGIEGVRSGVTPTLPFSLCDFSFVVGARRIFGDSSLRATP